MKRLNSPSAEEWNALIGQLPASHVLQSWLWGEHKRQNGWEPSHFIWQNDTGEIVAAALLLERQASLLPGISFRVLYAPKGPLLDWADHALTTRVLDDIQAYARDRRAIFLKIDPDALLGTGIPGSEAAWEDPSGQAVREALQARSWVFSQDQIQFRNTVLLDLSPTTDEILAGMKQKTRYNIRLASRKGVTVRQGTEADLPALYRMYAVTAVRDNFVIRHEAYYLSLWHAFLQASLAAPLIAEFEGKPIAGLMLFWFADRAYYLFGMSLEQNRELMPNYLLQWEAILLAKAKACQVYDLWGAPDVFDETDPMWGVFRFKEGFNGTTARHIGAWDFTPRPFLYRLYTQVLPRVLDVMRNRGKAQNKQRSLE